MNIEIYLSPLAYQTICLFAYLFVFTLFSAVFSKYEEERYGNLTIAFFMCSVLVTAQNILLGLEFDLEKNTKEVAKTLDTSTLILFLILGLGVCIYLSWQGILLPIYRAIFESDHEKDRRYGVEQDNDEEN